MKSVQYTSSQLLSCAKCGGAVIICIPQDLTVDGVSFIYGSIGSVSEVLNNCGEFVYSYGIQYDELQLSCPENELTAAVINGVFCRGCLTDYIESLVSRIVIQPTPGDPYRYIWPAGPPPTAGPDEPPYTVVVDSIFGNMVYLAWYQPT